MANEIVDNESLRAIQQASIEQGKERRRIALKMHTEGKSLREIGLAFGFSRERARQLVARAIKESQPQ